MKAEEKNALGSLNSASGDAELVSGVLVSSFHVVIVNWEVVCDAEAVEEET